MIPVATVFLRVPIKSILMPGEGRSREDQCEALFSIRDIGNYTINHRIRTSNEGLLHKPNTWIVKHPNAEMLVWRDDVDCIHGGSPWRRLGPLQLCWTPQGTKIFFSAGRLSRKTFLGV